MKIIPIRPEFNSANQRQPEQRGKIKRPSMETVAICTGSWDHFTPEQKFQWVLDKTPAFCRTYRKPRTVVYTTVPAYLDSKEMHLPMCRGEILSKPCATPQIALKMAKNEAEYIASQYHKRGIQMDVKKIDEVV